MAEVASLSAIIGADTSGFTAALAAAEGSLRRFAVDVETRTGKASSAFEANMKRIGAAGESLKDLGGALSLGVTAPLVLFGATALNAAGDFEAGFNRVEAATQASGAELAALRKQALDISLDPKLKFSATEAAAALENLAKNGLNTTQILGGAADATVNLATATGGQLASSADIATDVMNNFNLTAQQLAASVDNITGTTIASKLDIDNYRGALGQAGGVAGQLGVKFADFNTALAVTSSGFSSGSDAGTSFKTFLQRLVPQSKEAAAAMKTLGLNFFNAQGQLKPLREIAGELQDGFKGLSDQQRNLLGTQIFGSDSIRTALLLAKDGVAGFDKMAESIGKVDAAAQGEILSKGFNGSLEAAKSALQGFQIALGDSGLLSFGSELLKSAAGALNSLSKLDPAVLSTGAALAAAAAAVGPVLAGIGALGAAIPSLVAGFGTVGAAVGLAAGPLALIVVGVAATAAAIIANWDDIVSYFNGPDGRVFKELGRSVEESIDSISSAFDSLNESANFGDLVSASGIVGDAVQSIGVGITSALDLINGLVRTTDALLSQDWARAWDGAKQVVNGLIGPLANIFGFDYAGLREDLNILGDGPLQGVSVLKNSFLDLNAGLSGFLQVAPAVTAAGEDIGASATGAASGVAALTEEQQKALAKLNEALNQNAALSRALGQDKGLQVVGNDYEFVTGKLKALEGALPGLVSAFGSQAGVVRTTVTEIQRLKAAYEDLSTINVGSIAGLDSLAPTVGVNVKINPLEDSFTQGLKRQLADLALFVPPLNTNQFDQSAAFFEGTALRVVDTLQNLELPPLPPLPEFDPTLLKASVAGLDSIVIDISETLRSGIGSLIADSAAAFGELLATGASAGDVLSGVFKTILIGMAEFAQQFGALLIAQGTAVLFAKSLAANPVAAIAAGAALVALGSAAGALLKKGPSLSGGGGGAPSVGSGNTVRPNANARPEPIRIDLNLQPVELRQRGQDIAGILRLDEYRTRRTTGR